MVITASLLKTLRLPGSILDTLAVDLFEGKTMRQLGRRQVDDEGRDVSGLFVVADTDKVLLFDDYQNARRWANDQAQVNIENAPSLTYIASGHSSVRLIMMT